MAFREMAEQLRIVWFQGESRRAADIVESTRMTLSRPGTCALVPAGDTGAANRSRSTCARSWSIIQIEGLAGACSDVDDCRERYGVNHARCTSDTTSP